MLLYATAHAPQEEGEETEAAAATEGGPAPRRRPRRQQQLLPGYKRIRQTPGGTLLCWPQAASGQFQPVAQVGATSARAASRIDVELVAPLSDDVAAAYDGAAAGGSCSGWVLPSAAGSSIKPGAAVWLSEAEPQHHKRDHVAHHRHPQQQQRHGLVGDGTKTLLPEWLWCIWPGDGDAVIGRIPRSALEAASPRDAVKDDLADQGPQGSWRGWHAIVRSVRWQAAGTHGEGVTDACGVVPQRGVRAIDVRLVRKE